MGITKRLMMLVVALMLALMPAGWTPTRDPDADVLHALITPFCEANESSATVVSDFPLRGDVVSQSTGYVAEILKEDFPLLPTSNARWPHMELCRRMRVVDGAAIAMADALHIRPGMPSFYVRFRGAHGLLRFSRPAFDATRTRALVYEVFQCGVSCGSGGLVELARRDGGWVVAKYHPHWIS